MLLNITKSILKNQTLQNLWSNYVIFLYFYVPRVLFSKNINLEYYDKHIQCSNASTFMIKLCNLDSCYSIYSTGFSFRKYFLCTLKNYLSYFIHILPLSLIAKMDEFKIIFYLFSTVSGHSIWGWRNFFIANIIFLSGYHGNHRIRSSCPTNLVSTGH